MLTERQERFAQAYIIHRNATEAAKTAGYSLKSANNQGYRMLKNDQIQERIADLENELVTNIDVIEEIENQYTFAKANGHTNSAIKALELLSRIRGAKGDKDIDLSKEGLKAGIIDALKILGKKNVMELIKECNFT
jgi:phage terminase small subunit|tara:strand:+ start:868 stop:1275 length:408 start_codon:yes stop_codon:yes gene_type:complete